MDKWIIMGIDECGDEFYIDELYMPEFVTENVSSEKYDKVFEEVTANVKCPWRDFDECDDEDEWFDWWNQFSEEVWEVIRNEYYNNVKLLLEGIVNEKRIQYPESRYIWVENDSENRRKMSRRANEMIRDCFW